MPTSGCLPEYLQICSLYLLSQSSPENEKSEKNNEKMRKEKNTRSSVGSPCKEDGKARKGKNLELYGEKLLGKREKKASRNFERESRVRVRGKK